MNKRSLLNFAMCSLLLGSMPLSLVSCKDYDDDIDNLDSKTGNLSEQVSSLKTALDAANAAATAAANDAKAAAAKADTATQEASLAKEAAEKAKAEALEEALAEIEKLQASMTSLTEENAKQLAALSGRIDGIEDGLSNIDLSAVDSKLGKLSEQIVETNRLVSAMQVQITALENFKKEIEALNLTTKLAAIDNLTAQLNQLSGKVTANTNEIASIKGQLTTISGNITKEVSNAVNTIAGILSKRLTSVTLIPELYVNGIPTISFESAQYTKKVYKNGAWVDATAADGVQINWIISNNATQAKYRLNPGTLKDEDIDIAGMGYYTQIAQTRAEALNDVVTVSNAAIGDNGILTVNLGKGTTKELNLEGGKVYTVSLKVPVAPKHLFDGEGEAAVYSEFTALEESYFTPEMRFVNDAYNTAAYASGHLADSTAVYNSAADALIAKNIVYNKTFDLSTLVEGCKVFAADNHVAISNENLAKYGLAIRYDIPATKYEPSSDDKTNQQVFAKIDGNILTPIAASGTEGNKNIIGKQPIIRATLYDIVNKNIINVQYFKVKYTAEDMQPITFNLSLTSAGNPCSGADVDLTWDKMAKDVLEKLNDNAGMSKEEFTKLYDVTPVINGAEADGFTPATTLFVNTINGNLNVSTPVMSWNATNVELGLLKVGDNVATFKKSVTFKNSAGLYADIVLNLTWTITTKVGTVSLGTTNPVKWNGNTMKVTVVPMPTTYKKDDAPAAKYDTNILEGRNKPYVTGLTDCATYAFEYAPAASQTETYLGEALTCAPTSLTLTSLTNANQANLTSVAYTIKNDAAGKALVSKGGKVLVNVTSNVNGLVGNKFVVGTITLDVVKILNLQTTTAAGITDNSASQTFNLAQNILITDAYGNTVAQESTDGNRAGDYWSFYGIQNPVFDATGIMIAATADGANASTLASLNMTAVIDNASGELTFQNNGSAIQSDCYIIVPVTIKHLWGELAGNVAVPLKKKL